MKGLGIRDWGLGLNARVTLASLILLAAISACGGGSTAAGTGRGAAAGGARA